MGITGLVARAVSRMEELVVRSTKLGKEQNSGHHFTSLPGNIKTWW